MKARPHLTGHDSSCLPTSPTGAAPPPAGSHGPSAWEQGPPVEAPSLRCLFFSMENAPRSSGWGTGGPWGSYGTRMLGEP